MVNEMGNPNNELVKNFFSKSLPEFHLLNENSHGPYWQVSFKKESIVIKVSGDIGFSIEIFIDSSKYELWQYDRGVNNALKTTDNNILYQLEVLKKFINGLSV